MQQIGLYAWGGPGTIRLLKVKYHSPRIDTDSFMTLYEPAYLAEARRKLGVTDMWVTYSWGFLDETERPDRQYIARRLEGFQQNAIRTHAYIQGFNVVTSEFADRELFCRDSRGRLLPYSKGRALTCPNNPQARQLILDRVYAACQEDFDGVFIDNIVFGLPPLFVRRDYISFLGCSCRHCQSAFRAQYGYALPLKAKVGEQQIGDYLDFRSRSVLTVMQESAALARSSQKQFGVNLYDPLKHTPEIFFGYRLDELSPLLDYFLIENHALDKSGRVNNSHLSPLIESASRPVFVVSYRHGIGFEEPYGPYDLDAIWSEAAALGYAPCLKASEYTSQGVWHALDIDAVRPPVVTPAVRAFAPTRPRPLTRSSPVERGIIRLLDQGYAWWARAAFENDVLAYLLARMRLAPRMMRSDRLYQLGRSGGD